MKYLKRNIFLSAFLLFISLLGHLNFINAQTITSIAGNGVEGFSGNGTLATTARICANKMVVDTIHNYLYFSGLNWIRKIDLTTGILTTVAGNGQNVYSGDNGPAKNASFIQPTPSLAIDSVGNILVLDDGRLRRIDFNTGIITTIAGNGTMNNTGDGGLAINAGINSNQLLINKEGTIFLSGGLVIREIDPHTGIINFLTNSSLVGYDSYNMCLGPNNQLFFWNAATSMVFGFVVDTKTKLKSSLSFTMSSSSFNSDNYGRIYGINNLINNNLSNLTNATIIRYDSIQNKNILVVGNGTKGFSGDSGLAVNASVNNPYAPVFDKLGNLYFYDQGNARIRKVTTPTIDSTPFIQSFSPQLVCPGDTLYVNGEYLTGTNAVNIGGVAMSTYKITSDRTIWAVVPQSNTGTITVTNKIGSFTSTQKVLINNSQDSVDFIYTNTNPSNNGLSVINTAFIQVTSTINVGTIPEYLVMTREGEKLYYINNQDSSLNVLNTKTNRIQSSLKLGFQSTFINLSNNGLFIFIKDNNTGNIHIVNNTTNSITGSLSIPDNAKACISVDGSLLYVESPNSIYVFDSAYKVVTAKLNIANINGLQIDNTGENIYVSSSDSNIYIINTNTFQTSTLFRVNQPTSFSINLDGTKLFVFAKKTILSVFDIASKKVVSTYHVGNSNYLDFISFSPNNKNAYILNLNTIYKLDLVNHKIVDTIQNSGQQIFVSSQTPYCPSTLPVRIISFSGETMSEGNNLKWQVSNDNQTNAFVLQVSTDGISFVDLATVVSKGNGMDSYSFLDKTPNINPTIYYRLKTIGIEGESSYSQIVLLQMPTIQQAFNIYPNPATNFTTLAFKKIIGNATIFLYNHLGQIVSKQNISGLSNNSIKVNTSGLLSGIYVIKVLSQFDNFSGTLIISK